MSRPSRPLHRAELFSMGGHTRRRHSSDLSSDANGFSTQKVFTQEPSAPASSEDKRRWKGFCEIESEPVGISIRHELPCITASLTYITGILQRDAQALRSEWSQSSRGSFFGRRASFLSAVNIYAISNSKSGLYLMGNLAGQSMGLSSYSNGLKRTPTSKSRAAQKEFGLPTRSFAQSRCLFLVSNLR